MDGRNRYTESTTEHKFQFLIIQKRACLGRATDNLNEQ
jgi:hypothetical protein